MLKKIIIAGALTFASAFANAAETLNIADFGAKPGGEDATAAVIAALKKAKELGGAKIVFEKGVYNFRPDMGYDKYCFISNNDEGLKRIIFPIIGMKDVVIDGGGASFIFHGFVNPFVVEDSKNVLFENFSVDTARPFQSEGKIIAVDDSGMTLEFPEKFPFRVDDGILQFTSGKTEGKHRTTVSKFETYRYSGMLEFDAQKRETAYMAKDIWTNGALRAQDLGNRRVKIFGKFAGTVGNIMSFSPDHRNYPGFALTNSENVTLKNITIYNSGGMGVLGQKCRNVYVLNCKVTPSEGSVVSTTADATHFVNCFGEILLDGNLFENQKDDATNIHGIYEQIHKKLSDTEIITKLVHPQQFGFATFAAGDTLEFIGGKNMVNYGEAKVKSAERINKEYARLTFETPVPAKAGESDAVALVRDYPKITISNNIIRRNRARGMLLNCRGKTVVENNVFHSPGSAILFEGDACFWFEQGGVRDCVIRNNVFENCLYGVWGKAVISVAAGIKEDFETSRYNKNIVVENNTFKVFDDYPLLNAYCIDGLVWRNNTVEKTNAYPPRGGKKNGRFIVEHCDNIKIEE